jgi:hypothetical protein
MLALAAIPCCIELTAPNTVLAINISGPLISYTLLVDIFGMIATSVIGSGCAWRTITRAFLS